MSRRLIFVIVIHCVQKIGCTSEKNSSELDSFSLGFHYLCGPKEGRSIATRNCRGKSGQGRASHCGKHRWA